MSISIPLTKAKVISTLTLVSSHFDPHSRNGLLSTPFVRKPYLISVQTLNQDFLDPLTKASPFCSVHWNQVNSDPPHWNEVFLDHPHNGQVNFDVKTRTILFSTCAMWRVIHTGKCSCDTAKIRMTYVRVPTRTIFKVYMRQQNP